VKSSPQLAAAVSGLLLLLSIVTAAAQPWQSTLTAGAPGTFAPLRPLHASYRFGWSGFTAATGDVRFAQPAPNRSLLTGKVQTIDMVRGLWPFEVEHTATADTATLRPIDVKQTESVRSKRTVTSLTFDAQGVTASRTSGKSAAKSKRVEIPNLFDFQTALLYLRSQPLSDGNVQRIIVFPGKDPYLATITVERRERITVPPGSYNAIRMDLKLSKIDRNNELKPHKKFRKATVWLSDDADRILLRAEAEVFVGTVFAELQSVQFDTPQLRRD
jgi:hypothetical protein